MSDIPTDRPSDEDPFDNPEDEGDDGFDIISFKTVEEIEKSIVETPFRAIYQTNNFFLPQIKDLVDEERTVNLRPEYQRRSRWTVKQKSLLIESFLLNIPVPPIFLFEGDLARYEVMDGQQRLLAVKEFTSNQFKLSSLTILAPLNGRTYSQLPSRTKRTFDRASLSAIVLLKESRAALRDSNSKRVLELRKFVFERLNTGGKQLNAQEIRNAMYGSPFNDLIIRITRHPLFNEIWQIPPYSDTFSDSDYESPERKKNNLYRTMGDCQIALRFFALRNPATIRGSLRSILDTCMETNLELPEEETVSLGKEYLERLKLAHDLFDGKPFRLSQKDTRPSMSMYDAVLIALDRLWKRRTEIMANKVRIQEAYWSALDTPEKQVLFTGKAATSDDIRNRIVRMERVIESALNG